MKISKLYITKDLEVTANTEGYPEEPIKPVSISHQEFFSEYYEDDLPMYYRTLKKRKQESIRFEDQEAIKKLALNETGWLTPDSFLTIPEIEVCVLNTEDCGEVNCTNPKCRVLRIVTSPEPQEEQELSPSQFFTDRFHTEGWDKHDKKLQRYDYYDMIDFADQYYQQVKAVTKEEQEELRKALRQLIVKSMAMNAWEPDDLVGDLLQNFIIQRKQIK